jgi:hypothetical protein
MIGHAPKRERAAAKPSPDTENRHRPDGLDRPFPAADPAAALHPDHNRPLWDQYPETD